MPRKPKLQKLTKLTISLLKNGTSRESALAKQGALARQPRLHGVDYRHELLPLALRQPIRDL
jgi:hypothetical protein